MNTHEVINVRRLISSKNPKLLKWMPGFLIRYIERIVHQDDFNQFMAANPDAFDQDFCKAVLKYLNLSYELKGIENIPTNGKCIIVMNHPLGGMDAMVLVDALSNHRTDLTFIVNDLLMNLGRMDSIFIGINKHGKSKGKSVNQISEVFASDRCVCLFPAGLVSRKLNGKVRDLEWKKTFVKQAKINDQTIIPIHIEGSLSPFFYRLSRLRTFFGIKMNLEMLYLADELFRQRNQHIKLTVGAPIAAQSLDNSKSDKQWAEWFREHTYSLNP